MSLKKEKRGVIFTSVTGRYDSLPQPLYVHTDYDYICVTDQEVGQPDGVWRFMKNPNDNADLKRRSVWARLHPHLLFKDYDYSLYIDGNVQIKDKEFYDYVEQAIEQDVLIAQVPHPTRDCIYQELEQCLNVRKVTPWQYIQHRQKFTKSGLPHHWGLYENNVILRKHNDPQVIRISEQWWAEYNLISNRDQLSLMLVYWREQFKPQLLLGEGQNTRTSKLIGCIEHSGGRNKEVALGRRLILFLERKILLPIYRRWVHAEDYQSEW